MKRITKETKDEVQNLNVGEEVLVWNRVCEADKCIRCRNMFLKAKGRITSRRNAALVITVRQLNSKTCTDKCKRACRLNGYKRGQD